MSNILSIRIHEGSDVSEKEMIVLPKGATVYVPGTVDVHTTGPVCEVNVSIGSMSPEAIPRCVKELAEQIVELMGKGKQTPLHREEIHFG